MFKGIYLYIACSHVLVEDAHLIVNGVGHVLVEDAHLIVNGVGLVLADLPHDPFTCITKNITLNELYHYIALTRYLKI